MPSKNIALAACLLVTGTAAAQSGIYRVEKGDTIQTIAKRFHLSESALVQTNSLSDKTVVAGMVLQIPPEAPSTVTSYKIKKGDRDWILAHHFDTSIEKLKKLNPGIDLHQPKVGSTITVPCGHEASVKSNLVSRNAVISADNVIIRRDPSTDAEKVTIVRTGTKVVVLDKRSGWYKLKFPKGTVGWVRSDLVKNTSASVIAAVYRPAAKHPAKPEPASVVAASAVSGSAESDNQTELLKHAYEMRGTRYRWGMSSRSGVDCSGFTSLMFRQEGIKLPRISRDQAHVGTAVSRSDLKPGDLVFFHTSRGSRITHVGIYAGNGKFIHASSGKGQVRVDTLDDGYYAKRLATARRITGHFKVTANNATPAQPTKKSQNSNGDEEWQIDGQTIVLPKNVHVVNEKSK